MIRKIVFFIRRRHAYWLSVPYAEITELYLSRFLQTFAYNLVNVFVTVYLYQKGYSLVTICLILAAYYGGRTILGPLFAHAIAWLGPKTAINVSNILAIPSLLMLSSLDAFGVWSLVAYFLFQGLSLHMLLIAADVQFSSVKSEGKAGGQIGSLLVFEKIAAAAAPAAGGLMATQFGPEKVMWVAAVIMAASAIPLLLSPERIRPRQRVIFSGFPWSRVWRQVISPTVRGGVFVVAGGFWALFIALAIFSADSSSVYTEVGVFFSISFIASMLASKLVGYIVDKRRGEALLRAGVLSGVLINLTRPLVATPLGVGLVNVINETSYVAYALPTIRGQYDMADHLPGYRVSYFTVLATGYTFGACLISLTAAGLIYWLGDIDGLRVTFVVMAALMPLIAIHGFDSLRRVK